MIYLVRHGQTEFNVEGRYQGRLDSPLTDLGRRQALAFGQRLAEYATPMEIWASPLPRAMETARLLALSLPEAKLTPEPRLQEISLGQWDGLTRAEIAQAWPNARKAHPPKQWMFHAPDGERLSQVTARLLDVLHAAAALPGDVVLVSHGITGRLMRGLHVGLPLAESLHLDARQDLIWCLGPEGSINVLPATEV